MLLVRQICTHRRPQSEMKILASQLPLQEISIPVRSLKASMNRFPREAQVISWRQNHYSKVINIKIPNQQAEAMASSQWWMFHSDQQNKSLTLRNNLRKELSGWNRWDQNLWRSIVMKIKLLLPAQLKSKVVPSLLVKSQVKFWVKLLSMVSLDIRFLEDQMIMISKRNWQEKSLIIITLRFKMLHSLQWLEASIREMWWEWLTCQRNWLVKIEFIHQNLKNQSLKLRFQKSTIVHLIQPVLKLLTKESTII